MIIDVFSKYGWAVPLKYKTGLEVENALRRIFKKNKCKKLWVDSGTKMYTNCLKGKYHVFFYPDILKYS